MICLVLILCMACGFTLSGCTTYDNFKIAYLGGSPEVQEPTIKIGVYEPLSGAYKQYGTDESKGIELAHELYPEVLGKKVELIYADNRSNMYDAETALSELMSQSPSVVLGSYGEVLSLVASDYMVASSTPAITITCTNPLITTNNDFYFTASFSLAKQGAALLTRHLLQPLRSSPMTQSQTRSKDSEAELSKNSKTKALSRELTRSKLMLWTILHI